MVLNGQLSSFSKIEADIWKSFLFLIYLEGLSGGLTKNPRFFNEDFSCIPVRYNIHLSVTNLSSHLSK